MVYIWPQVVVGSGAEATLLHWMLNGQRAFDDWTELAVLNDSQSFTLVRLQRRSAAYVTPKPVSLSIPLLSF
jgi:hypothetical protein